jgi:type III restriction enzyme
MPHHVANVVAFAKNSGLGFAIPYFHNGRMHGFMLDHLVRLANNGDELGMLILEVRGYGERAEVKTAAARRWVCGRECK